MSEALKYVAVSKKIDFSDHKVSVLNILKHYILKFITSRSGEINIFISVNFLKIGDLRYLAFPKQTK